MGIKQKKKLEMYVLGNRDGDTDLDQAGVQVLCTHAERLHQRRHTLKRQRQNNDMIPVLAVTTEVHSLMDKNVSYPHWAAFFF